VEPQDILQDAYAAAWQGFSHFDYLDDGAFLRWMCRIIDHRLRDANDYFTAAKRQIQERPQSAPTGPLTALARAENREQLQAALGQLSEEHREVILLRYFQGLSAEEAGTRMQRSAGAIRSLLSRALVELGKQLKSGPEPSP
jgi:RNA polymerase sigma-70 factor (ECF subfamily)